MCLLQQTVSVCLELVLIYWPRQTVSFNYIWHSMHDSGILMQYSCLMLGNALLEISNSVKILLKQVRKSILTVGGLWNLCSEISGLNNSNIVQQTLLFTRALIRKKWGTIWILNVIKSRLLWELSKKCSVPQVLFLGCWCPGRRLCILDSCPPCSAEADSQYHIISK